MASALSKQLDYKHIAETYSNVNGPQIEVGKELVSLLGLKGGEKVLDMGCGTGELTSYIAAQVGDKGRVVGVDPDEEKIKVAMKRFDDARESKFSFVIGDSSSHFPHYNEEYYDIHFSNFVIHWLTPAEKGLFLKTAAQCLKPGGRIAIHSEILADIFCDVQQLLPDDEIERDKSPFHVVTKATAESMLQEACFEILSSGFKDRSYVYANADDYITTYCASCYLDESKIVAAKREAFAEKWTRQDGTVQLDITTFHIVAKKL